MLKVWYSFPHAQHICNLKPLQLKECKPPRALRPDGPSGENHNWKRKASPMPDLQGTFITDTSSIRTKGRELGTGTDLICFCLWASARVSPGSTLKDYFWWARGHMECQPGCKTSAISTVNCPSSFLTRKKKSHISTFYYEICLLSKKYSGGGGEKVEGREHWRGIGVGTFHV